MSNYGAKPTGSSSPAAIVRFGLTRAQCSAVAQREPSIVRRLAERYDRATFVQIVALCDARSAS